jgi:hypothetical protein
LERRGEPGFVVTVVVTDVAGSWLPLTVDATVSQAEGLVDAPRRPAASKVVVSWSMRPMSALSRLAPVAIDNDVIAISGDSDAHDDEATAMSADDEDGRRLRDARVLNPTFRWGWGPASPFPGDIDLVGDVDSEAE